MTHEQRVTFLALVIFILVASVIATEVLRLVETALP